MTHMLNVSQPTIDKSLALLEEILEEVRREQNQDGSARPERIDRSYARRIAQVLDPLGKHFNSEEFCRASVEDFTAWLNQPLIPPDFTRSRDKWRPPRDTDVGFFWGPVVCPNSNERGARFEYFIVQRDEPSHLRDLNERLPHPLNISVTCKLLAGSPGFREGNCVVFFPENISAATRVNSQRFALFFFNKFHSIYNRITLPAAKRFLPRRNFISEDLSPSEMYGARATWGFLHDFYHHQGPRPLHKDLTTKLNFHAGLLEELKVDCQAFLIANSKTYIPHGKAVAEMILMERLFRYPLQPDAPRNFDAGTGFVLFEWLNQRSVLTETNGELSMDRAKLPAALLELVGLITSAESEHIDSDRYRKWAREFIESLLPPPSPDQRLGVPKFFTR